MTSSDQSATYHEKEMFSPHKGSDLSASNNNFSIQSTFPFSNKSGSLMDSNHSNHLPNIYDLDTADKQNYTPPYSNNLESDFYPNNSYNFNCDLMNIERDIKAEDHYYGGSFMFNLEDYFTI